MKNSPLAQNILYGIILSVAILAVVGFRQPPPLEVRGIFLPSGKERYAPIAPEEVAIYTSLPPQASVMGLIRTTLHFESTTEAALQEDLSESVDYAKALAGDFGAQGLLLTNTGITGKEVDPLDGFVLYAEPIRFLSAPVEGT